MTVTTQAVGSIRHQDFHLPLYRKCDVQSGHVVNQKTSPNRMPCVAYGLDRKQAVSEGYAYQVARASLFSKRFFGQSSFSRATLLVSDRNSIWCCISCG